MLTNMMKMLKGQPPLLNIHSDLTNSYSHSLVVLPYDYRVENTLKRVSEGCLRQSLHRAETGFLKNSVNISICKAERRLKRE